MQAGNANFNGINFKLKLKPNDKIHIVAPASKCKRDVLPKVEKFFHDWQLNPLIPEEIFARDLLSANTTSTRVELLLRALYDEDAKAIWCLRGGYGASQLIPYLSTLTPPSTNKLFIGFSDITALHIFLQQQWGWPTIHGPSAHQLAQALVNETSVDYIRKLLFAENLQLTYPLIPLNAAAKSAQQLNSQITGGNLSLIQTSLGTSWQINCAHKILLFEEINERAYRIARTLEHLKQAGIFNDMEALIIGDCLGGDEPNKTSIIPIILQQFADACEFPVLSLPGVGHGNTNLPIVMGSAVTLVTGEHCQLSFTA